MGPVPSPRITESEGPGEPCFLFHDILSCFLLLVFFHCIPEWNVRACPSASDAQEQRPRVGLFFVGLVPGEGQPEERLALDGLGMGVGFTFALLCLGGVREILGSGSLFGLSLFPDGFQPWVVMILPSGGFFTLGILLLVFNRIRMARDQRERELQEVTP